LLRHAACRASVTVREHAGFDDLGGDD